MTDRIRAGKSAGQPQAQLLVLSRAWCHLCDELLAELAPLAAALGLRVEVRDIDAHPEYEDAWGEKVPVLFACAGVQDEADEGSGESLGDEVGELLCYGRLDAAAVRARFPLESAP